MSNKEYTFNLISIILSLFAIIIPLIIFILTSPEQTRNQSLIIFGIIVIVVILFLIFQSIYSGWKNLKDEVKSNHDNLTEIKKSLNLERLIRDMEVRLRILESLTEKLLKNKRGQSFDPRILFWILLVLLLILFLKSVGFF